MEMKYLIISQYSYGTRKFECKVYLYKSSLVESVCNPNELIKHQFSKKNVREVHVASESYGFVCVLLYNLLS